MTLARAISWTVDAVTSAVHTRRAGSRMEGGIVSLRLRLLLLALAGSFMLAGVGPAASATTTPFRADVHDLLLFPGVDLCGSGVIQGFGTVTTTLTFATGERIFTLDSDGSTLRLLLQATGTTGKRINGTWTILGGSGVFAGATGSGELWATPTGAPETSDTAHFRGTITLSA